MWVGDGVGGGEETDSCHKDHDPLTPNWIVESCSDIKLIPGCPTEDREKQNKTEKNKKETEKKNVK